MHKLYIVEMENTKHVKPNDGRRIIKFGTTHHMDIMNRFNPDVDDGYEKNYQDWKIRPCYSQVYNTKEEAQEVERRLLHEKFPPQTHKVWIEQYLGCTTSNEYYNNTGVTEIRLLTQSEISSIIKELVQTQSIAQRKAKRMKRQHYNERR